MDSADTDDRPAGTMGCAVCARVLDRWDDHSNGSFGWMHSSVDVDAADHDPVAVSLEDLRAVIRCDFCLVETTEPWRVPVAPFNVGTLNYVSSEDWAACPACADLVRRQSWRRLETKSLNAMLERHVGDQLFAEHGRTAISLIQAEFRKHLKGKPMKRRM